MLYYLVMVLLPDPFRGIGAQMNSTETQHYFSSMLKIIIII